MKIKKHETASQHPAIAIQAVTDHELVTVTGGWSWQGGGWDNWSSRQWSAKSWSQNQAG